jgi:NADH-quinone oxidoreductase subunit E
MKLVVSKDLQPTIPDDKESSSPMATRRLAPPEVQPKSFDWSADSSAKVAFWMGKYPEARKQSAVIPLLWLAQKQEGWVSEPALRKIALDLAMAYIRVYEVATFYTMYNLAPVGRYHVQVCGTTPCMLRGSDDVMAACKNKGLVKGGTTPDGLFTLNEVECLGACANAPMVQINDDNFEDLTYDSMSALLDALANGKPVKIGPQIDRQVSCPEGGPTTLNEMVDANHDYRKAWK